jgi:hypothetical protein
MHRGDLDWLRSNRPLLISQIIGLPIVLGWFLYLYLDTHDAFTLVLICLVPVFAVANVVLVTRSRRRLSDSSARTDELTGEAVVPVLRSAGAGFLPLNRWTGAADMPGKMGRMNASTPLAVLELSERSLSLKVRPSFLASLFGVKPLVVAPEQVEAIFPAPEDDSNLGPLASDRSGSHPLTS